MSSASLPGGGTAGEGLGTNKAVPVVRRTREETGCSSVEVAVLIGLQASGKTTFYRQRLAASHVHVSKDAMPNARNRQGRQMRSIDATLAAGRSVAVDNTNPSAEEWRPVIDAARRHGARVAGCWFPPDLAASFRRNAARARRRPVPDVGLYATHRRLRRPRLVDGFDELYAVRFGGAGGFVTRRLDDDD